MLELSIFCKEQRIDDDSYVTVLVYWSWCI